MSGRGVDFLENWIQQNVTDIDKNCSVHRSAELAENSVQEAAKLGITRDDMEPEFGCVQDIIYDAAHSDVDAELAFWKAYGSARDK